MPILKTDSTKLFTHKKQIKKYQEKDCQIGEGEAPIDILFSQKPPL